MHVYWLLFITWALCVAGFAALSLAMHRHFVLATGRRDCAAWQRRAFRLAGGVILWIALGVSQSAWGTVVGTLTWSGVLTLGATAVVLGLTYRPGLVPILAGALGALALLTLTLG